MLAKAEKVSFAALKKGLGLPAKTTFTHEGNEQTSKKKEVIGDRSAAKIRAVIGDAWEALGSDQQERLLEALTTFESETSLARHLGKHYAFSTDHAKKLATVSLEEGYSNLSRKALQKVLTLMEAGKTMPVLEHTVIQMLINKNERKTCFLPCKRCWPTFVTPPCCAP